MAEDTNKDANETAEPQLDEQSTGTSNGILDAVSAAVSTVAEGVTGVAETVATAIGITGTAINNNSEPEKVSRRAQRVGTVSSDKMTKTVVVNVDRQIMHPKYRRIVRRRTKFMAHDELGAGIGDRVRIEESRPLSARKRWRVIEIVQKAAR